MKKLLAVLALGLSCISYANAAVVVIGNNAGPGDMSKADAKKLFLGKGALSNGAAALVFELDEGNPLRSQFHELVTGKSDAQLKAFWSKQVFTGKGNPPATVASAAAMKTAVASAPNAIGYLDEADVDASVKVILKP
ncbi:MULTISPECIES: phosphate ABC transporter substrate-binding protein [Shewanella]|uniref:Phosphate ABC transporter substrate-binding protein n=1 Tax=Shewanella salipaludis TaxID=2723052 RepID=A0A972JIB3_9GAMM|nr:MULTISPECIES: phosphate ABC transporter substrate-binding protein [Shewanella]MCE9685361.1 phosphate ABC transporter substrate-binding protein [Shewanella sp. AS16]NMH64823.1 phosphate ABC transporter substrate-binding protein [Shewanella salipaludis]